MTATASIPLTDQQHIVLDGVSWQLYERLLADLGDRPIRVTFDNGSLEMMAPLPLHEHWKKRIARLIELLAFEADIEIQPYGSTTFRREDLLKGLEPDECYYVRHAEAMLGKRDLDLTSDPPPDLAVEIDITRRSIARQPIYAALGVPELWRFDGRRLRVFHLSPDKTYNAASESKAFPFLPISVFESYLLRLELESPRKVLKEFRDWVRTLPHA